MMHEGEKSDSAIVAVKPTNKAGRSAAEPVEPRAGTEGNADQQSTRRTQDRESVSQALGRIRKAARERKKENQYRPAYAADGVLCACAQRRTARRRDNVGNLREGP